MNSVEALHAAQDIFTSHVRDPQNCPAPEGIEDRRMAIYRELIYNNIEGFLSSGFPVLRSLLDAPQWHRLVRNFIRLHRCRTPLFLEISQEFLRFLQDGGAGSEPTLPFMLELAHYEWVELALDVSPEEFPETGVAAEGDLMAGRPVVSPLAWRLCYQYPVQLIGPAYQPSTPPVSATYLIVYRNRQQQVRFLESNAATVRLLQLLEDGQLSGREALQTIAAEMRAEDVTAIVESGRATLKQLLNLDILCGTAVTAH